jgi:hypothetical protein
MVGIVKILLLAAPLINKIQLVIGIPVGISFQFQLEIDPNSNYYHSKIPIGFFRHSKN